MAKSRWFLVLGLTAIAPAASLVAMVGCSSSSSNGNGPSDGGSGDSSTSGTPNVTDDAGDSAVAPGNGDGAAATVSLTWEFTTLEAGVGDGDGDAAADAGALAAVGVKVCVYQMPSIPCVTTDDNGLFTLTGLPPATQIVITADKTGYRSVAKPVVTPTIDYDASSSPIAMQKSSAPDPSIGTAIDWVDKGQVWFFVLGPNAGSITSGSVGYGDPGATVTVTPASGVGPIYLTDQNTFSPSATSLIDLLGSVYNVTPGNYTMTVSDPINLCEAIPAQPFAGWGYPGAAHQVLFPVIAGYTTVVGELCYGTGIHDAGTDAASHGLGEAGADAQ